MQASAHILWETGTIGAGDEAVFQTASGVLTAARRDGWIEMDFPARSLKASTLTAVERGKLVDAIGAAVSAI